MWWDDLNARYVQIPLARSFRFPRSSPSMFQVISEKLLSSSVCCESALPTPALLVVASAVRSMLKRECTCLSPRVILTYLGLPPVPSKACIDLNIIEKHSN